MLNITSAPRTKVLCAAGRPLSVSKDRGYGQAFFKLASTTCSMKISGSPVPDKQSPNTGSTGYSIGSHFCN